MKLRIYSLISLFLGFFISLNAQDPNWEADIDPSFGDPNSDFVANFYVTVNGQPISDDSKLAVFNSESIPRSVGTPLTEINGQTVFQLVVPVTTPAETGTFKLYDTARGQVLVPDQNFEVTLENPGGTTFPEYQLVFTAPTQPINFPTIAAKTYGDATFELSATSGVDTAAITYASSDTGVVTVAGTTVTIVGAGETTITASLDGTNDVQRTLTVDAKALTVTGAAADNKEYDGTTSATASGGSLVGIINNDTVSIGGISGSFENADVGDRKTVTASASLSGADAGNYTVSSFQLTADITPRQLSIINAVAQDKNYDGTNTATIAGATLSGVIGGDVVSLVDPTSGSFATASAGSDISVVMDNLSITGADAGNYLAPTQSPQLSADIIGIPLTVTADAVSKVYNGTVVAEIQNLQYSGLQGNDLVTLVNETEGVFAQAAVGNNIAVSFANTTLQGTNAESYQLVPQITPADIAPKLLIVSDAAAEDKEYDGTTDATVTGGALTGVVGQDVVVVDSLTGQFDTAAVAVNKTVTANASLTGVDAGNYSVLGFELLADVTQKQLSIINAVAQDKDYDGTDAAMISGAEISGIIGDDDVSLVDGISGTFVTADSGNNITVTLDDLSIAGADAGNYLAPEQPDLTASIIGVQLTVSADAVSKVYDGGTVAMLENISYSGRASGDEDVRLGNETGGLFVQSAVGTDIAATFLSEVLIGANRANYSVVADITPADIAPKPLTINDAVAEDKEYDGTADATVTGSTLDGVVGQDAVTVDALTGQFDSPEVAVDKTVTANVTLSGADAGNYTVAEFGITADVTRKQLSIINAVAQDKDYDGSDAATISGAELSGLIGDDQVSLVDAANGSFDTQAAGSDKTVTFDDLSITGADAGNYLAPEQPDLTASIIGIELTVTADAVSKVYDGTTVAEIQNVQYSGLQGGDSVNLVNETDGVFEQKEIGTGLAVSFANVKLQGRNAESYQLVPQISAADITAKELTISGAAAQDKVYDGTTDAVITGATLDGVVEGDDVELTNGDSGTFASTNVGSAINVATAMGLTGTDAGNYTLQSQLILSADITIASQTITFPEIASPQPANELLLLNATASSGLPIIYTVDAGPAQLVEQGGNTYLEFTGIGEVTVRALQAGTSNYEAAADVTRTFTVVAVITSVTPAYSPKVGGVAVVIEGIFIGAGGSDITDVVLAGVPVASIQSQSVDTVTVLTGVSPVELVGDVEVTSTTFGTATLVDGFAYSERPDVVEALSAIDVAASSFKARWLPAGNAEGYLLEVSESADFSTTVSGYAGLNVGPATEVLVDGLTNGITYYYRVTGENLNGQSDAPSNVIEVPVGPNTPYVLRTELTEAIVSAGSSDLLDLMEVFRGEGMIYEVEIDDPTFVTYQLTASMLTLSYPGPLGVTDVSLRVVAPDGFSVLHTIRVTVVEAPSTPTVETLSFDNFNRQNGLFEQVVEVRNESAVSTARAVRLTVTGLKDWEGLYNSTGEDSDGNPVIDWSGSLGPQATMEFVLRYSSTLRGETPTPVVSAKLAFEQADWEIDPSEAFQAVLKPINFNGERAFIVEFPAEIGDNYIIQYSGEDMKEWKTVNDVIEARANRVQWIDSGPPFTDALPGETDSRFYRVVEVNVD